MPVDLPSMSGATVAGRSLARHAARLRIVALDAALRAGKGHIPPAFSWVEMAVALFHGGVLRLRPKEPAWPERDRFILSKGHGCLTLYAAMADLGFFDQAELDSFAKGGALLPGHPDPLIPGVEAMSGSLGHGLGVGAGMALGARLDGRNDGLTVVVLGDGELHEGSIWEAAMFAAHHKLSRLTAIIDRNGLASTGYTEEVLSLEPLADRWRAFGWDVIEIDGHSFDAVNGAFNGLRQRTDPRPLAVIARTVKGKGVSFMENSPLWHHRLPKGDEIEQARRELNAALAVAEAAEREAL